MKNLALFILMLAMCLSLASCMYTNEVTADGIISSDDVKELSNEAEVKKVVNIIDYAYIRGGSHAKKNWKDINDELGISQLVAKPTTTYATNHRKILLKFDFSNISPEEVGSAYLNLKPTDTLKDSIHFNIYITGNDWERDTVTWNIIEALPKKLVCTEAVTYGNAMTDISLAIKDQLANGNHIISFVIDRVENMANETRVNISDNLKLMPDITISNKVDPITAARLEAEAEAQKHTNTLYLSDYGYIRAGKYENTNWKAINKELGINELRIKTTQGSDVNLTRMLVLKFDLSQIKVEDIKTAYIDLKLSSTLDAGTVTHYDVYLINNDWTTDTVTWNKIKSKELILLDFVSAGLQRTNIADAVKSCIESGERYMSLMFERVELLHWESVISLADELSALPTLTIADSEILAYKKTLSSNPETNAAYWSLAEEIYDAWLADYEKIKLIGDDSVNKIKIDQSEFSKTNQAKPQNSSNYEFADYKTRTLDTLKDFSTYPKIEYEYDIHGGIKDDSVRQDPKGFFYAKKLGDRWWIIDPLGYPYYISGLDVVQYSFGSSATQYNAAFSTYGSFEKWAIATTRHLRYDLGFNSASRPSSEMATVVDRISTQLHTLYFMSRYAEATKLSNSTGGSTTLSHNNTLPVFNPDFATYCNTIAQMKLPENINDPYIIGYTLDNELPMDDDMLDRYLTLDYTNPANFYSYATAWTWFIKTTGKDSPTLEDITEELRDLFRGFVYNQYYKITTAAVRKYDTNHMILGSRYLTEAKGAEWVMRVSGYYCDVITQNWYHDWTPNAETLYNMSKWSGKPILVTEFYVKAGDAEGADDGLKNTAGAGWFVKTQQDRGDFYQTFTLRMLECQNVVGWYWLQYGDNDPYNGGVDNSSTTSNKGIISNTHREYTVLTEAMAEINHNIPNLIRYFNARYSD